MDELQACQRVCLVSGCVNLRATKRGYCANHTQTIVESSKIQSVRRFSQVVSSQEIEDFRKSRRERATTGSSFCIVLHDQI